MFGLPTGLKVYVSRRAPSEQVILFFLSRRALEQAWDESENGDEVKDGIKTGTKESTVGPEKSSRLNLVFPAPHPPVLNSVLLADNDM